MEADQAHLHESISHASLQDEEDTLDDAVGRKRRSIEQEVEAFRLLKEQEFQKFVKELRSGHSPRVYKDRRGENLYSVTMKDESQGRRSDTRDMGGGTGGRDNKNEAAQKKAAQKGNSKPKKRGTEGTSTPVLPKYPLYNPSTPPLTTISSSLYSPTEIDRELEIRALFTPSYIQLIENHNSLYHREREMSTSDTHDEHEQTQPGYKGHAEESREQQTRGSGSDGDRPNELPTHRRAIHGLRPIIRQAGSPMNPPRAPKSVSFRNADGTIERPGMSPPPGERVALQAAAIQNITALQVTDSQAPDTRARTPRPRGQGLGVYGDLFRSSSSSRSREKKSISRGTMGRKKALSGADDGDVAVVVDEEEAADYLGQFRSVGPVRSGRIGRATINESSGTPPAVVQPGRRVRPTDLLVPDPELLREALAFGSAFTPGATVGGGSGDDGDDEVDPLFAFEDEAAGSAEGPAEEEEDGEEEDSSSGEGEGEGEEEEASAHSAGSLPIDIKWGSKRP